MYNKFNKSSLLSKRFLKKLYNVHFLTVINDRINPVP